MGDGMKFNPKRGVSGDSVIGKGWYRVIRRDNLGFAYRKDILVIGGCC